MEYSVEAATSGRAKCRGCGQAIAKGELRLGEHLPNPFADRGRMTLWFHLRCATYKRPDLALEALAGTTEEIPDPERLRTDAEQGLAHRRLPRVDGAQRSPTGRAKCRSCREAIPKDSWRISLVYYEDGRFEPSGFVHVGCCEDYFGTTDLVERAVHFAPDLTRRDVAELRDTLG